MKKNKFTVVIIDDEQVCIDSIRQSITDEYPELHIVGEALTAKAGRKLIMEHQPDLPFVDIEMSGQTGLELLENINERITWPLHVIFHNACEKHLLDVLRASAFNFLLKPYSDSDFKKTMSHFFKTNQKTKTINSLEEAFKKLYSSDSLLVLTTFNGYQMLKLTHIGYFEYQKEKRLWKTVLTDRTCLWLKRDTSAHDILNYSNSLIQINQHQIINVHYLHKIEGPKCNLLPPFDTDIRLESISRKFMAQLEEKFKSALK
jgi:two-component system LytT family response regulator